jgi:hypothetical protein
MRTDENIAPDIWRLFKRSKRKIFLSSLLMGFIGALFAIIRPIQYQVEGTFREKGLKQANINSTLLDLLISGSKGANVENEAITILKSQKAIYPLINQLNLQGKIERAQDQDGYAKRIKHNVLVEFAHLTKAHDPILPDFHCPLSIEAVSYRQETPLHLEIVFLKEDSHFNVLNRKGGILGNGQLNVPFKWNGNEFTLTCLEGVGYGRQTYLLTLWPLNLLAKNIKKNLRIDNDHYDKNLLLIDFKDSDRHFATKFVNALMSNYQNYLKEDHDRQAAIQVAYLQQKQEEAEERLQEMMQKHAKTLSEDLSNSGFADSAKEMDFLANSQHQFKERLISNELEIKRLQNVQNGKCVYYDLYSKNAGDHNIINSVLEEIRDLKQQRDALTLALKNSPYLDSLQLQNAFRQQQLELEEVQNNLIEIDQIIQDFDQGIPLKTTSKLLNNPNYTVNAWYHQLNKNLPLSESEEKREQFKFYLDNLKRLFTVHSRIIKERLTHQQNPSLEYQGIQLDTARELYLNYSVKLNDLEAKKRENAFVINQMNDPHFEVTSLSSILNDPVSSEMIQKASRLLLDLKDRNNRSDKEQEQIKEELHLERGFLLLHLQQTNQLVLLNQKLVEEKIYSLQNITLELIHQQISVLEKNLHDYIETRLDNLKQEHTIIQEHMDELHQEMATLPKRWASEKMIEQNLEINELILQEVAKMVESKNISHKLELVQSAPIDLAIAPIHPLSPGLILFSILGAMVGGLLSFGTILRKNISQGFMASSFNLKHRNQHVAGKLSVTDEQENLETLRRLQTYLCEKQPDPTENCLLLIEGVGPDYSEELANLFIKRGQKTLILRLNFNGNLSEKPGLLQYLEGEAAFPTILNSRSGDVIEGGGSTSFSNELICSEKFKKLLCQLKGKYDWVIAVSDAIPSSALAENLLGIFSCVAITVNEETVQQLAIYMKFSEAPNKKVTFLMTQTDDVE